MKILCDIGGTYARFALYDGQDFKHFEKYKAADFESFEAALAHYKSEYSLDDFPLRIATAAYPDRDGLWRFVNQNSWAIDPSVAELILNDFEAAVWGLKNLKPEDQSVLKAGQARHDHPKCLIGPGTGLGLGYLINERAQKTHGGHMLATALTEEHQAVIKAVGQGKSIVFEKLISGPSLMNIYCAVSDHPVLETTEALLDHVDETAVQDTLRLFHEFFGLFAHTVIVSGHAYGGLYLTGGVLDRLIERDLFDFKHFEEFFVLDGVHSVKLDLDSTPIIHIKNSYLAMHGLIIARAEEV